MEPRIQYAQTADGVGIAYYTLGEGEPLVGIPSLPFGHLQLEWQMPEVRRWYERLAQKRRLVRYDPGGAGLSDRDATDFSLDARIMELEAVVDRLALETFVLWAGGNAGPAAIAYAARHPERVSHLILWCTFAKAGDYYAGTPQIQSLRVLRDKDWEVYTETAAHLLLGWSQPDVARRLAAFLRESVRPETAIAAHRAIETWDVEALLPQVRSPTLVLHRRGFRWLEVSVASALASRIPDAQLVVLEGEWGAPFLGDAEAVMQAIDDFLGQGEEARVGGERPETGTFRTILFTDVEGSTALTQRLGDARARQLLRQHERIVRESLKSHGGSEVKTMGDGFMASFSSAARALECAIAMQRAIAEHNESAEEPIRVRVGLNAGEPIAEEDSDGRGDLFGTAVIRAARIAALAEGGEILVANVVRELAEGKEFMFGDRGEAALRGFDDPVRLFEVRWRE